MRAWVLGVLVALAALAALLASDRRKGERWFWAWLTVLVTSLLAMIAVGAAA